MADGEIRCQDLAVETASTLSGNEKFVMFDSTDGKQADIDDVATYIAGDKTALTTTNKTSPVAAINEVNGEVADVKEDLHNVIGGLIGDGEIVNTLINGISTFTAQYAINGSGVGIPQADSYALLEYVPLKDESSVHVSWSQTNFRDCYMYINYYNSSKTFLSRVGGNTVFDYTDKVPSGAKYCRITLSYAGVGNVASFLFKSYYEINPAVYPYLFDKNGIILGDSISYGLYSYWDGANRKNSDGLTPDYAPTRISDYFGILAGMNVANIAERGTGYVADSRGLGNALVKANATNFANYNFVGLCFGINDYLQSKTLGTISGDAEGTVVGNLMRVLKKIYNDNSLAKVVIFSPYNAWGQVAVNQGVNILYGDESTNYALGYANSASYTLQDLVDAIDEVAQYYGVTHERLNKSNVVNRINIKDIMIDGLHPSLDSLPMLAAEMFAQKDFG